MKYLLYFLNEGKLRYKYLKSFDSYQEMLNYLASVSHDKVWYKYKTSNTNKFIEV